jgi:transcription elongation factor Elf1
MAWRDERSITVTKWQALFHHEQEIWETDYAAVQTVRVVADPCDDPTLREMAALYIEEGQARWTSYAEERSRRVAYRQAAERAARSAAQATKYSSLLAGLDLDWEGTEPPDGSPDIASVRNTLRMVKASNIDLREITDASSIWAKIYPRTFVCTMCGHYQLVDDSVTSLKCPCCGKGWLQQEAIIHICPRCAKVEELVPEDVPKIDERGWLICKCGEHLHYYGRDRVATIRWQCKRGHQYPRWGRGRAIDRSCSCSIWEKDESGKAKVSKMYIDRTAGSNTYALSFSTLRIGDAPVALATLQARHQQDKDEGTKTWHIDELFGELSSPERLMFRVMFPVREAFLVSNVQSSTVIYGYSTRKGTIKEEERLPQFFYDSGNNRYRAYVVNEQGRALVIVLDKERLAKAVQRDKPTAQWLSYDQLIENEISALNTRGRFQQHIDTPENFPLVAALHTLEHAIFRQALAQVGLDDFGSKILLRDGVIVLYERRDIGYGGVVQLTAGQGFLQLMRGAKSIVEDCNHDCEKGCLACVYITDAWCMPFLRDEVGWYPPNSLLMRREAVVALELVEEEEDSDDTPND